jgi:3-hydroxymyristoyl/3-hydroxydecanoyl-(acyl carrier protein) dehydratase
MDTRFSAFSFVDRITQVEPEAAIRGQYFVPTALDVFSTSLVCEAVGQLAAWAAMAAVGFTHRPVAGIARKIELIADTFPGQVLDLAADLDAVDTETVAYSGTAHANGKPVVRLLDCVGPMVPAAEFDDPQVLRDRFSLLIGDGAHPGAFEGLPLLDMQASSGAAEQLSSAILRVPTNASFFADHFPRRRVFPGTLLMQANLQIAALLAARSPPAEGAVWVPRVVANVKLRTFIAPGETLSLEAKRTRQSETSLVTSVESRSDNRLIGSAEILFVQENSCKNVGSLQ